MARGKGELEEFCKLCGAATFYCVVILGTIMLTGLGLAKISVGVNNLQNCSVERYIPIYLIGSGIAPCMFCGVWSKDDLLALCGICCAIIGFLFSVAWLICGTVWIYPTYALVTSSDFKQCVGNVTSGCTVGNCPKSFLNFAVAMVTIDWLFMLLFVGFLAYLFIKERMK